MESMKYLLLLLVFVAIESYADCTTVIYSDTYSSTDCKSNYRDRLLGHHPYHYKYSTFTIDLRPSTEKRAIVPISPYAFSFPIYDYYKANPVTVDLGTDPYGIEDARMRILGLYPENQ